MAKMHKILFELFLKIIKPRYIIEKSTSTYKDCPN